MVSITVTVYDQNFVNIWNRLVVSPLFDSAQNYYFFAAAAALEMVFVFLHRRKRIQNLQIPNTSESYLIWMMSMDLLSYIYVHEYSMKCT